MIFATLVLLSEENDKQSACSFIVFIQAYVGNLVAY
jgi:hypothetical protein